ncbi:helix-turn-helix transcriptional regulator [Hydrogenophaga defluvii]|uniref:Helix-turn-helix transcriptional regulator n=1 Tax=Hydrogenophaga defluvii TaxID=249410 RepID=A0ABW2SFL4_9BURK
MNMLSSAYAARLVAARRAAGLTQADVAKRVGVAQSTYSKWEAGESDMQAIHIRPLAKALGLNLEDVVPMPTLHHEYDDPSERIGLLLIQRVASAIENGRLGSRQARILLDLLEEIAPERKT